LRDPASVGIPAGSTYQIATLCPPYEEVVYGDLLEAAVSSTLVTDDTVILIEYPVELGCLPHVVTAGPNTAVGVRNRRYGRTVIAMYVINPTGKLPDAASSRPEEFVQV
jgi:16S rRNA (guanine966-N2)-methyltransferase